MDGPLIQGVFLPVAQDIGLTLKAFLNYKKNSEQNKVQIEELKKKETYRTGLIVLDNPLDVLLTRFVRNTI